jgi:hypothetical protein
MTAMPTQHRTRAGARQVRCPLDSETTAFGSAIAVMATPTRRGVWPATPDDQEIRERIQAEPSQPADEPEGDRAGKGRDAEGAEA